MWRVEGGVNLSGWGEEASCGGEWVRLARARARRRVGQQARGLIAKYPAAWWVLWPNQNQEGYCPRTGYVDRRNRPTLSPTPIISDGAPHERPLGLSGDSI